MASANGGREAMIEVELTFALSSRVLGQDATGTWASRNVTLVVKAREKKKEDIYQSEGRVCIPREENREQIEKQDWHAASQAS